MDVFWYFIEFVMCAIEVGIVFILCYKALGINERFEFSHALIGAGCLVLLMWIATCIAPYSWWKTVFGTLLFMAFIFFMFSGRIKDRLIYIVLALGMLVLSDVIATAIIAGVKNSVNWEVVLSPTIDRAVTYAIAKLILSLVVSLLIRNKFEVSANTPFRYWFVFISSFSLMLICVLSFMDVGFSIESNERFNVIVVGLVIVLLAFYFVVYFFYYRICNYFNERNEQNLLVFQNEMIEKYALQKQESDRMIRILDHDLKHNLSIWRQSLEKQDYQKVIDSVMEYEKTYEKQRLIDVQNEIANAIFNQKMFAARNKNIQYTVQGVIHRDLSISQIDFIALLGNLLDNAIEAAEKVDRSDIRYVDVTIDRNRKFLLLEIVNNYSKEPIKKNGSFVSSKKDRTFHGVGLLSINHVLSKHEGNMIQTYENGVFKTTVGLRIYTESM